MRESRLISLVCSAPAGNNQLDTLENDFFLRKGGRSRSGNGGGGTRPPIFRDEFAWYGVWVGGLVDAVCGGSEPSRSLKDGALGGRAGISGMGSISAVAVR